MLDYIVQVQKFDYGSQTGMVARLFRCIEIGTSESIVDGKIKTLVLTIGCYIKQHGFSLTLMLGEK